MRPAPSTNACMPSRRQLARPDGRLRERAKELNCLYQVEETADPDRTPSTRCAASSSRPSRPGWQYPDVVLGQDHHRRRHDLRARRLHGDALRPSAPTSRSMDKLGRPPSRSSTRAYCRRADERAVHQGGAQAARHHRRAPRATILHQRSCSSMSRELEGRRSSRRLADENSSDWRVIIDFLRRTDPHLLHAHLAPR
ncbi:MAG: hypothetical protein MZV64_67985 [Ignavibacteriales bacterium]|nr:hypothetical protein [Ignavibacteriales bacterium]